MVVNPYLTFIGISNVQFEFAIKELHGDSVANALSEIIAEYDTECNIVVLEPDCLLDDLGLFTHEQIRNICNHVADTFGLRGTDWHVFTTE